jgi:hypothetical protein
MVTCPFLFLLYKEPNSFLQVMQKGISYHLQNPKIGENKVYSITLWQFAERA